MSGFLHIPDFSPFWFWLGVLMGSLFWYALTRFYPTYHRWQERRAARRAEKATSRLKRRTEEWRRWVAKESQGAHLASPLFPLDAVLVPPKVVARMPAYFPQGVNRPEDIALTAVPYTPDFPELASLYHVPTLTLPEALQNGANLLLWGRYGSGKSTALAYLALLLARRDPKMGDLADALPVLVHVADLPLPLDDGADPLDALFTALGRRVPERLMRALRYQIPAMLQEGQMLLLIDGADEMAPTRQPALAAFLRRLMKAYPRIRMVVAASPEHHDGLLALGLRPVTLALWSETEAQTFLRRWGKAWQREIVPMMEAAAEESLPAADLDPLLLNRWLLTAEPAYHPLELTLKAWAAYAGDALGPSYEDAVWAYIRRMLPEEPDRALPALEALALQLTLGSGDAVAEKEAGKDKTLWEDSADEETESAELAETKGKRPPKVRRLLPSLLESGLLVAYNDERIGFVHPTVRAYFAARALTEGGESRLLRGDWWEGRTETLGFLSLLERGASVSAGLLERDDILVHAGVLAAGRALSYGGDATWRGEVLRALASLITDLSLALNLRARAVVALALSGEKGIGALFRKIMGHQDLTVRWLAALGAGAVRDTKAVDALLGLLYDPSRAVQRAAALALVAIGTDEALEGLAAVLLSGDDLQRRIAAEALANHPQEGYPTLKEAVGMEDDLRVRRAAVYGLARVPEPWAQEILAKVQVEDSQWVVRDAAAAVLEQAKQPSPCIPKPLEPLHEAPWLIAFAAEHGMGVAPGQPALTLLHKVLAEGTSEQKEAALERVPYLPGEDWTREVYNILYGRASALRDAAFDAVWTLHISGVTLPSPVQFGFG